MEGEDENRDSMQRRFMKQIPWKRRNQWSPQNPKKKGNCGAQKRSNILVFDGKSNTPKYAEACDDGTFVYVGGGGAVDTVENTLVDKDDFLALHEVMKEWGPLRSRKEPHCRRRFITALDAMKEFLGVNEADGTCNISKFDLSQLMEERTDRHPMRKSNIRFIPATIGKLNHLQELNLTETNTDGIPTKILVGCKHLKVLNLSYTQNLLRLPDEIGNLSELRELYLGHSAIQSLPHYSVLAKLVKLEILDLSGTSDLRKFENHPALDQGFTLVDNHTSKSQPGNLDASGGEKFRSVDLAGNGEEKLKSLRRLYLRHSAILKGSPSSPPLWKDESFRRFFMSSELLCDLDLSGAKCFGLSDIVRDSNSLEKINLSFTDIATLPQSSSAVYDKLARLKVLSLTSTPVLRKYPQQAKKKPSRSCTLVTEGPPLRDLVLGRHSKLGCIGLKPYQTDGFLQHRTIRRALALNRARFRMASIAWIMAAHESPTKTARGGNRRRHQQPFPPRALWPILLSARRAVDIFRPYEECCDKSCDCHVLPHETDALFDILVTFGHEIFGDRQRVSATHNNRSSKDDSVSAFDSDGFVLVDDWTPTKY